MLEPPDDLPATSDIEKRTDGEVIYADEGPPEGYAEPPATKPHAGTVDFFSSLGTEHRPKKQPKPDPTEVRIYIFICWMIV